MELERVALPGFAGGEITDERAVRHIVKVLRLRPGAEFLAYDGESEHRLRVTAAGRDAVQVEPLARRELSPVVNLTVAQCILKGPRWDLFLEKMCELGVARILPVVSERVVARPRAGGEKEQVDKWRARVLAAAAQCAGRAPEILPVAAFADVAGVLAYAERRIVLCFNGGTALPEAFAGSPRSAAVLIGPEGDFTPAEIEAAAGAGFLPAHAGPRILRSETAAMMAAVIAAVAMRGPAL